jgi:spore germination protein (amino acid permease)
VVSIPNSVKNRQIIFILFTTITCVTIITIPKMLALSAKNGFWLTVLIGSVIFGLIAILICKLNLMFEGQALYDYSQKIVGKGVTYVIAVFYIVYFFIVSTYLCDNFADILHFDFLLKTPQWGELIIGIPLFGYIAYKGITNVARLMTIIGTILFIVLVILFVSMLNQGTANHIKPLYILSQTGNYITAVKEMIVPLLGAEVLLVIPFTVQNKKAARYTFFTFLGIGLFYILATAGCIMMIGMNEIIYLDDPLIEAIRLVQYQQIEFLQRVDIIYMVFGFMGVFAGKSMVYLVIVEYVCRMFPRLKRIYPVIAVGIIVFFSSTFTYDIKDIDVFLDGVISVAGMIAVLVIPGLLYIIAKVKKHAGKVL